MRNPYQSEILKRFELGQTWTDWQENVVAVLEEFEDVLPGLTTSGIDWNSWRPLYEERRSPHSAVHAALMRG